MKLLIIAATKKELGKFPDLLVGRQQDDGLLHGALLGHEIRCLITGVGSVATAMKLGQHLATNAYDLVINAGIAGAFPAGVRIGETVLVGTEVFGDLGVEDGNGNFLDLFEVGLLDADEFPYEHGVLNCNFPDPLVFGLPIVKGLTVNCVHGSRNSIHRILEKYHVEVESMEGAAVFYTCLELGVVCLQIRSISNIVESRNRENWDIPLAIDHLEISLRSILSTLSSDAKAI